MVEIEYKFTVEDIADTITGLEGLKAKLVKPRTYELSVMYDNSAGLMQKTDGRIRVRQSGEVVEFCYKKPLIREGVKHEIEHQVEVDQLDPLLKILEAMEFSPTTSYERHRTEYELLGVKVTLDICRAPA